MEGHFIDVTDVRHLAHALVWALQVW
jgi:hypothetical protein